MGVAGFSGPPALPARVFGEYATLFRLRVAVQGSVRGLASTLFTHRTIPVVRDKLLAAKGLQDFGGSNKENRGSWGPARRGMVAGASRGLFSGLGFGRPQLPEIVQAGDPVLHERAQEVSLERLGSPELEKTIDDMIAVMRAAPGVGLSANQIGVPLRIIVLEDTEELMGYCPPEEVVQQQRRPFPLLIIINPVLRPVEGARRARFFEGCLSVAGFRGMVERHLEVEVSGVGRDGTPIEFRASGWQARILQHECDHLDGLLYVDQLLPRTFRISANLRLPLPAGCPTPGLCQ